MMYIQSRRRKLVSPFSSFFSNSFLLFSLHFPLNLNCPTNWKRIEPTHSEDPTSGASSSSIPRHGGDREGGDEQQKGNAYDVFLSFRGKDTRKSFTDYLYTSLVDVGIHIFRDDNELRVGEEIGPELLCNITKSKISIPIISENYASSKWCLLELAQMLKCKRRKGQMVLPIFYKLEPSQVRHPTGKLRDAINAHKKKVDKMVVKEWEEALKEVSSLKGWESEKIDNGHEGTLVKIIVRKVLSELKRLFQLSVPEQLVGIDDRAEQIKSFINANFNGTRIIGIHGMGGIGKTTLAKVLYNKLSSHFDCRSFMANIRETSQRRGIEYVQKQLISAIIKNFNDVSNVDEGICVIKSLFTNKDVLILLDDMDDDTHLNALVGDGSWFTARSVIIITTRNKSILDKARASPMYQLNELPLDQSLILFSRHAFLKDSLPSDYEIISRNIVSITGGLPLALEVIGSFLRGKKKGAWKDTLKKLKQVPDKKVQETLKISYNALDFEDQQIFLDIACCFIGSSQQSPTYMWDACDFYPGKGIEVLSLMSLIKLGEDGKLMMHDQLRDLGREIVRLENPKEPRERSRLWIYKEALDVLDSNKGTRKIEALCLGKCGMRRRYTAEQFKEMTNLRLLQVVGVNFTGDFQSLLPKLRWLQWVGCPSDFAAANFYPKKLVVLDLSFSAISENWGGWVPLKVATELKVLNLMGCESLRRTPDLSAFESLEILILQYCKNLKEIHPSIGDIRTLVSLDVRYCYRLEELPKGIGRMVKLKELLADDTKLQEIPISKDYLMKLEALSVRRCVGLSQLPISMGFLVSLTLLDLFSLKIEELPKSISSMKKLKTLNVASCNLLVIPSSIGDLASLQYLSLRDCKSLREIPDSIGKLASLIELDLTLTPIAELPESIGNLQNLRILKIGSSGIRELPSAIGMLTKLQKLEATVCKNLERLPSSICELVSLEGLFLDVSGILGMPEGISKLSSLQQLRLASCQKLRELRELPYNLTVLTFTCLSPLLPHLSQLTLLKELSLSDCPWLECLPELPLGLSNLSVRGCGKLKALRSLSNLKHLSALTLDKCFDLTEVSNREGLDSQMPDIFKCTSAGQSLDFSCLKYLSDLHVSRCKNITEIRGLDGLESLLYFRIFECTSLRQLPDLSNLKNLRLFYVFRCENPVEIQGLDGLESLRHLEVIRCTFLSQFVDLSNLKNLQTFRVEDCENLVEIQGLNGLESLESLRISGLTSLRQFPHLSNLKNLKTFTVMNCFNLVEIQGLDGLDSLESLNTHGCISLRHIPNLSNLKNLKTFVATGCRNLVEIQGLDELESLEFFSILGCTSLRQFPEPSNLKNVRNFSAPTTRT